MADDGPSTTNCMHRVKSTLLMLTTHLTCVTITTMMYFVTVVTNPSFLPRQQFLEIKDALQYVVIEGVMVMSVLISHHQSL